MKTKTGKNQKESTDINELIKDAEMWALVSLDKDGVHYRSSMHEEGLALIALMLGSNEDLRKIVQEYIDTIKFFKQKALN